MLLLAWLAAGATPYLSIYEAVPSRAEMARSVPELKQIGWMVGRWRCHQHAFAVGSAPARDFGVTTYKAKFIMPNKLNGDPAWLQLVDEEGRDLSFYTFDPLAKQWVLTGIEWPVSYGVSTGALSGNRLVVIGTSTVFGRKYRLRQTVTKLSNDKFTLLNEEQKPDGSWIRDDQYDFARMKP